MWFRKNPPKREEHTLFDLILQYKKSGDFVHFHNPQTPQPYWISYFGSLIDVEILHRDILPYLNRTALTSIKDVKKILPFEDVLITSERQIIEDALLRGSVLIQLHEKDAACALVRAEMKKSREVTIPEEEYSVVGPKEAFVESITTNLNLVRTRLPISELQIREYTIGSLSKTKVAVLYIEGIANEENINTVCQRLENLEFYQILDSSFISQLIEDNGNSLFPQLIDTERPDRVAGVLAEGSVVIIVDGSSHALIGPISIMELFNAFEDYYINWQMASAFRLIRVLAVSFSILVTPIYVAVLTYHYQLIPKDLMVTLVSSRRTIPLPPFLEAVILELTIELLREAGARLPTKVGQTIGIVGGIVIGTAAVDAGLTSNVLLIIVALAALASFTTPVYRMGNTIRLLRFPFLLMAELWGLLGIAIAFLFLMNHLLRLTSLGRPYLEPIYPPRMKDLKDAIIRLPFSLQSNRPHFLQPQDQKRFLKNKASEVKDIDE
ncbi:spore germination protein [Neobacillus rhizophilus]|uniref:Spore germination protein n=1 Tax=Neobacillus rhizophilus TaxID=2833579 RepID=A0A942U434_9BACI|nr:spore germination protein [Neobacillus rhizophilus]MBS4212855.1 spore germination protein [Neobacillus rhizophilus]MBU8919016.1 spore germination protein [Bacillus sp. FJAT-29953]